MSLISWGKTAAGADALIVDGHEIPVSFLAVGAAGLGGLLVLRARSSSSNVARVGTTPAAAAAPATSMLTPSSTDLSSLSDAVATLSNELSNLQTGQVGGGTTTPPASGGGTVPPASGGGSSTPPSSSGGEVQQGSGFWFGLNNPTPINSPQGIFSWLSPAAAAQLKPGTPTYYQPQPGVFALNVAGLLAGTPAFLKLPAWPGSASGAGAVAFAPGGVSLGPAPAPAPPHLGPLPATHLPLPVIAASNPLPASHVEVSLPTPAHSPPLSAQAGKIAQLSRMP